MKDKIILEMFNDKSIDLYCKNIDYDNADELKSELVIQLYKMTEEKLAEYYSNNCIIYICFTIIKRIKYGTITDTGIFYNKNKFAELIDAQNTVVDTETEINHYVLEDLEAEIKNLHWYSKILFEMYYKDEMTLKQIAEKTGINLKSVHYSIKKTRIKLKKKLTGE